MNRPIDGLFEVLIDDDYLADQMERASKNKSRQSSNGPLLVIYHPCSKAQADYLAAHPQQLAEYRRREHRDAD